MQFHEKKPTKQFDKELEKIVPMPRYVVMQKKLSYRVVHGKIKFN